MNIERMSSELAQATAYLAIQSREPLESVREVTFLDRGELIAIEVNGRVVGEVDKLLLIAEPPPKPGVN